MKNLVAAPLVIGLLPVALILGLSGVVNADEDRERAALARLLVELDALNLIIHDAQTASLSNTQKQFDYLALRCDVRHLEQRVKAHLDRVRREPRPLPANQGNDH